MRTFRDARTLFLSLSTACLLSVTLTGTMYAQTGEMPKSPPPKTGATETTPKTGQPATTPAATGQKPTTTPPAPAFVMQVKKEIPGDLMYRFVSKGEPNALQPIPGSGSAPAPLTLPLNVNPQETTLEVLDPQKGTMARLLVDTKTVTPLMESLFKYAQVLYIPVQAEGKGVALATVRLESKSYPKRAVQLTEGDRGVARFEAVPLDEPLTITATYGANPPKTEIVTLTRSSGSSAGFRLPALNVDWKDAKTVEATNPVTLPTLSPNGPTPIPTPAGANPGATPQPSVGGGTFGSIASTLISLLFLAGVGYGVYWAYQNGKIKPFLDKLGIQPGPPIPETAAAPNPFAKVEKPSIPSILDGTTDPLTAGAPMAGMVNAAPPIGGNGPRLVAMMGVYSGSIFPIAGETIDIGRDTGNAVSLPNDTNASRRHATLQLDNGQAFVTDLGSSNGTFINGVRIAANAPQRVRSGDEVQIGMTRFRFEA